MNTLLRVALVGSIALPCLTFAAPAANAERHVTLEMRKDNGPYKKAAYSFRVASQDPAVHKNYIDLLLNKCGQLHVSTVTGVETRVCDLGAGKLADAPKDAPADAKWFSESIKPEADHLYREEIKGQGQTMTAIFHVDAVTPDTVSLTWKTVVPMAGPALAPNRGAAGTQGQCGGEHTSS